MDQLKKEIGIFVGNLHFEVDENALTEFFSGQGFHVTELRILRERVSNRSKCCGFVRLLCPESQTEDDVCDSLRGLLFRGRPIHCDRLRSFTRRTA